MRDFNIIIEMIFICLYLLINAYLSSSSVTYPQHGKVTTYHFQFVYCIKYSIFVISVPIPNLINKYELSTGS